MWAKPGLTDSQVRTSQARASRLQGVTSSDPQQELTSTLKVQGLSTGRPSEVLQALIGHVSASLGAQLRLSDGQSTLKTHEWLDQKDVHGQWTGRISLKNKSEAELRNLYDRIHGLGMEIEGVCFTIELENSYFDLDATGVKNLQMPPAARPNGQGNGKGGMEMASAAPLTTAA